MEFKFLNNLTLVNCEGKNLDLIRDFTLQYRIVFVQEGTGTLTIDSAETQYEKDCIFFIKSGQEFHLIHSENTCLFVMLFENLPVTTKISPGAIQGFADLYKNVQFFYFTINITQTLVISNSTDRLFINYLIELITFEMESNQDTSEGIIKNSIFLLVNIIARNQKDFIEIPKTILLQPETDAILGHINEQVGLDVKVDIEDVSRKFGLGASSVDRRIMAKTGLSFKKYVVRTKMDLFKSKLLKTGSQADRPADG